MPLKDEKHAGLVVANPGLSLRELDRLDAEEKLIDFATLVWPVLEPGRQLVKGWCIEAIADHLEAVTHGDILRLLINVPPGTMKSLLTSVLWPAWEWGPRNMPSMRYVCAAYAQALTIRDNRRCRNVLRSENYQGFWGDRFRLLEEQDAKTLFGNDHTGFKLATSVDGVSTGERGDRVIIDDPHSVKEVESEIKRDGVLQWFTEVVPTRINDPMKSAIVLIMQRTHEQDVSGHIISSELGYTHLMLPMEYEPERRCVTPFFADPRREDGELLWPERFPKDYLDNDLKPSLRSWGGVYAEAGQLQQRPAPRKGGMFLADNWHVIQSIPEGERVVARCRGWDFAGSKGKRAAYTVGARLALTNRGKVIIEDIERDRWTPNEVDINMKRIATADKEDRCSQSCPQDPGQAGLAQKSHMAVNLHGITVNFSLESGAKEDRARPLASQQEAGNVYLLAKPWNKAFIREATSFPAGEFKDQVDACSRAYHRLLQLKAQDDDGVAGSEIKVFY